MYKVAELHLAFWTGTACAMLVYIQQLKSVTYVTIPPGRDQVARRSTSLLSLSLGRRVLVESRTPGLQTPWQRSASFLLHNWLLPNFLTYSKKLKHITHAHIYYGPGYEGLGGDGDSTEDEDDEIY